MQNTIITPEVYIHLYKLTVKPTPLRSNCGELCDGACCRPGEQGELGMYLFPGEETMFTRREEWLVWEKHNPVEYDFPNSWEGPVYFVRCNGACPRELRPLACRFFPLAPHLYRDGTLQLIYETMDLPYRCPLITSCIPLEPDFIRATKTAWKIMLQDKRIRDLVWEDSRQREKHGLPIQVVSE